jgi:hypothetical protein
MVLAICQPLELDQYLHDVFFSLKNSNICFLLLKLIKGQPSFKSQKMATN